MYLLSEKLTSKNEVDKKLLVPIGEMHSGINIAYREYMMHQST
jgi:hypothetical protein